MMIVKLQASARSDLRTTLSAILHRNKMKSGDIMYPKTTESIKAYLEDFHIKPSLQRIMIYKFLSEKKSHPTVEEIYTNLCPDLITLSKTTVYNTLHLFVEKGSYYTPLQK